MTASANKITKVCPTKQINQNTPDSMGGSHQRNPSWVVCVVPFEEAAAMLSGQESKAMPKVKKLLIIENDCLNVNVSNTKSSFGKMCNISLKSTNIWYPGYISPGDWLFIWMLDTQEDADRISIGLHSIQQPGSPGLGKIGSKLCDEKSGLKFAGRVLRMSTTDTTTNSSRTVTQQITGQSFLEFATSVYYTYAAKAAAATLSPTQINGVAPAALSPFESEAFLKFGIDETLGRIAEKFLEQYKNNNDHSPDTIIGLYYCFVLGVDSSKAVIDPAFLNKPATGHHIIKVPPAVAAILGQFGKAEFLWQLINVQLGMQKYTNSGQNWWQKFQPEFDGDFGSGGVIKRTKTPTEGFVPFHPAIWDNQSVWSIFSQYLNDVVNEMYTVLRINGEGKIAPTFVVREKPFSTGLLLNLNSENKTNPSMTVVSGPSGALEPSFLNNYDPLALAGQAAKTPEYNGPEAPPATVESLPVLNFDLSSANRTLFGKLPRWIIGPEMIKSYTYHTDEGSRVNFVQVWGRNSSPEFLGIDNSGEAFKQTQFNLGNAYPDNSDITRNGLRAMIKTSNFDIYQGVQSGSFSNLWAAKNADWYFNGHLHGVGSVTLAGVTLPICEGDNCQIGDIVYHIESVSHSGTISGGKKSFDTNLTLSRGMLAVSFEGGNIKKVPLYPIHLGPVRDMQESPGYTEIQDLTTKKAKTPLDGLL